MNIEILLKIMIAVSIIGAYLYECIGKNTMKAIYYFCPTIIFLLLWIINLMSF